MTTFAATPGAGIFRTQLPQGFICAGINSGVRQYRPDLGIIISTSPSVAAGVFTKNTCKAAPILYCMNILPAHDIRAIITNSGQANAATGAQGEQDNETIVQAVADILKCQKKQVLSASTGVIGERLDINKMISALPDLISDCSTIAEKFALAILTTDLVPKTVCKQVRLSQGIVNITGICKGSAMIHPNMGTMLGYILTDAALTIPQTQHFLKEATELSFNMISVDGETSTNDCVFMLANGASHIQTNNDEDVAIMQNAINEITIVLAKSIAQDGEGATKLMEAHVSGLNDLTLAKRLAKSLIVSPLLKTAAHGCSPNWGRIMARLGSEEISIDLLNACTIFFQQDMVFTKGQPIPFDKKALKQKMQQDKIFIQVKFNHGPYEATAWGCDLSARYVKINAEYVI